MIQTRSSRPIIFFYEACFSADWNILLLLGMRFFSLMRVLTGSGWYSFHALQFPGWKWKFMRDHCKLSYPSPPLALLSFFACGSRVTSFDSPKWRACSQSRALASIEALLMDRLPKQKPVWMLWLQKYSYKWSARCLVTFFDSQGFPLLLY